VPVVFIGFFVCRDWDQLKKAKKNPVSLGERHKTGLKVFGVCKDKVPLN